MGHVCFVLCVSDSDRRPTPQAFYSTNISIATPVVPALKNYLYLGLSRSFSGFFKPPNGGFRSETAVTYSRFRSETVTHLFITVMLCNGHQPTDTRARSGV